MIHLQTGTPPTANLTLDGKDDADDASDVDFKSHLQAAKVTPKAHVDQPKPPVKKPAVQDNDSQVEASTTALVSTAPSTPLTDLGAAITRALSALQGAGAVPATAAVTVTATATTRPTAPVAPGAPDADGTAPLTPLEQAVHDIIAALPQPKPESEHETSTDDEPIRKSSAAPSPAMAVATSAGELVKPVPTARTVVEPAAPLAEPRTAVELPLATSHMHLVVGDGDDRVVLTIAVRGQDVNVSMRGSDDHTADALARNAASLDHAMRARGLDLATFSAARDPDRRPRRDQPDDRQPQREDAAETFALQDKP